MNGAFTNVAPGADADPKLQVAYWRTRALQAEKRVHGLTVELVRARGGKPVYAKTRMASVAKGPGE